MTSTVVKVSIVIVFTFLMAEGYMANQKDLCNELISKWLYSLKPKFESENATLTIGKAEFYIVECKSRYIVNLNLELWIS